MAKAKDEIKRIRAKEQADEAANLVKLAETDLEKAVAQDAMDQSDGNPKGWLEDVSQHGCQSGIVSGMIYYNETVAFYDAHVEDIWNKLYEDAEGAGQNIPELIASFNGAKNVGSHDHLLNLLAWYAYESAARAILDRLPQED